MHIFDRKYGYFPWKICIYSIGNMHIFECKYAYLFFALYQPNTQIVTNYILATYLD